MPTKAPRGKVRSVRVRKRMLTASSVPDESVCGSASDETADSSIKPKPVSIEVR